VSVLIAAALAVGVWTWFVSSTFVPLADAGRPLEYVFIGAPWWVGVAATAAAVLLLITLARRLGQSDFAKPLLLLSIAPLALVALVPGAAPRISVLLYLLVDLRPWWTTAIVIVSLVGTVIYGVTVRSTAPASAILFVVLAAWAIATTPQLRFDEALHGDEPKYLRFCENWYQGNGLEVGNVRTMGELGRTSSPPLWRNVGRLGRAVREDTTNAIADARLFLSRGFGVRYNRAEYAQAWIVRGRNGGYYQVHNPGLSVLLFPAYFADRHFVATGAGHQGVFPNRLPTTNLAVLLLWAGWGVALFALLRVVTGDLSSAWGLAALGMMTMPVAAFGFQIYPEAAAGIVVCSVLAWTLGRGPRDGRLIAAIAAGAATGFLPWLHVRFLVVSLVLVAWAALRTPRRTALVACYALAVAALCAYAYHITGSLRPDAMYAVEGAESAWIPAEARQSIVSMPFDRIWGFFPHAVVYLLAIPGWVLLARASRALAIGVALIVLTLAAPVAGHGFTAAGATPLRQLAAVIPLLLIPVWATLRASGHVPLMRVAVAFLVILSLDTAVSYNLHHYKEVGRHIDAGFSGWAPNLLFPWTHGEFWSAHRGTFVLFGCWVAVCVALSLAPFVKMAARITLHRAVVAVTLTFVLLATGATALGGEWTRNDYFVPAQQAHDDLVRAAVSQDRCRLCVSSTRGLVGRSNIVEVTDQQFAVDVPGDTTTNTDVHLPFRAWTDRGIGWGTVAVDFGDGTTTRTPIAGRTEVRHRYTRPGAYRLTIRFEPGQGTAKQLVRVLTIR
jgi:hypothetical protein